MKRLCIYILAALVLFAACKKPNNPQPAEGTEETTTEQTPETNNPTTTTMNEQPAAPADKWAELGEEPMLKIKTTDGTMTVKLYAETPLHRDNFVKLARSGFYDGLLFHRIIKGFMIQGGDPFTKDSTKIAQFGTGGPGYTIPAEIVAGKTHKKGALAAARRGDQVNPAKESSGSQFYIVQDEEGCKHLDGEYTIFGEVVDGLTVIDKIASERTDMRDRPIRKVEIISITPAE
jgi:cyclophilin family peptidyl-prolyl cis-trans isomerase